MPQGKRKSSKPLPKKKDKGILATTFRCLFCNSENSVTVKIDKKIALGSLACKVCGQSYESATSALSAPVDVYADWVDACEEVSKQASGQRTLGAASAHVDAPLDTAREDQYEDDGFIERDDEDDEGGYRPE